MSYNTLWPRRRLPFSVIRPQTMNVGASFGPRISTAGFEWRERHQGMLSVRLYADLDGNLWQDDGDVCRRGAHAVVAFSKRASEMIRTGKAHVETAHIKSQDDWYRTTLSCFDEVEGFERRLQAEVDFPSSAESDLTEAERRWVERFDAVVLQLGTSLHVEVHDPRNASIFLNSKAG